MTDLKVQHILTLTQLISKGARHNFVPITTSSLGKSIQKSQQAASKHLLELEKDGFIKRIMNGRKVSVKITPKGYSEMLKLSSTLKTSLKSFPSYVELKGTLVSGMGEGAYYMSLKGYTGQFRKQIGYVPFPGTLNVKLLGQEYIETAEQFIPLDGNQIKGFSDGKRTYGWVKCFKAKLNNSINCDLIILERTHHDNSVIELISKFNLRDKAKIKNGSTLTIKIPIEY